MHALRPIAIDCLKYKESKRPSSEELCQRLAGLKESTKYRESVEQQRDEIRAKDDQLSAVTQQLREMNVEKVEIIQAKDRALQQKERQHQEEIASRERQHRQLSQQLEEQKQVTAEIQHRLQVEQIQQRLSQQIRMTSDHKPHPPKELKVTLTWRDGYQLPFIINRGAAVMDGDVAYFVNWDGETCSYNSTSNKWSELPKYPY